MGVATIKVFGCTMAITGFALTIISIWLLSASLRVGCNRMRGTFKNYVGSSGSGLYWEVKPATRTGSSRFYLGGLYHDQLRRDPTSFCEDLVDRWTAAGVIGIIVGSIQMIVSAVLVVSTYGGALSRLPLKPTTLIWILVNLFFVIALIAAFALGIAGHVHESQEVDIVGPLSLAIQALDMFLSALLPCIAGWLSLRTTGPARQHYFYTKQLQQPQQTVF